tara:strand:- start:1041 stop:1145 length:105 start_codon:yes stop_codon:yes gene_type:complete
MPDWILKKIEKLASFISLKLWKIRVNNKYYRKKK